MTSMCLIADFNCHLACPLHVPDQFLCLCQYSSCLGCHLRRSQNFGRSLSYSRLLLRQPSFSFLCLSYLAYL